jgi:hypothetical protein
MRVHENAPTHLHEAASRDGQFMEVVPDAHLCDRRGVPRPIVETLVVERGSLGPVPPCELEIKPMTVFIGRQGTGKSLAAQVLYFFRALPSLVDVDLAESSKPPTDEELVRSLLDRLRSPERAFAGLADPSVTLRWTERPNAQTVSVGLCRANGRARPDRHLRERLHELREDPFPWLLARAVFVPTERILYSMVQSPRALRLLSLSGTYIDFASWLARATTVFERWDGGAPDTAAGRWIRLQAAQALGGEARRRGTHWKWHYRDGRKSGTLDIDMASSGQRAAWPLILLAEALLTLKRRGQLSEGFTVYVEEPEIHLHPRAEVAVAEILAYLVNRGLRVVVTTHSLTTLYAINNLSQAGRLKAHTKGVNLPAPHVRLPPASVAAYRFGDGPPVSLVNEHGFINESALGDVAADLGGQMNAIGEALRREARTRERADTRGIARA